MTDIQYVQKLIPEYDLTQTELGIRCKSVIGIDNEKEWNWFKNKIIERFKKRFQELYHEICYNHEDFWIYFKQQNI